MKSILTLPDRTDEKKEAPFLIQQRQERRRMKWRYHERRNKLIKAFKRNGLKWQGMKTEED
jgi:hypothetical protein